MAINLPSMMLHWKHKSPRGCFGDVAVIGMESVGVSEGSVADRASVLLEGAQPDNEFRSEACSVLPPVVVTSGLKFRVSAQTPRLAFLGALLRLIGLRVRTASLNALRSGVEFLASIFPAGKRVVPAPSFATPFLPLWRSVLSLQPLKDFLAVSGRSTCAGN